MASTKAALWLLLSKRVFKIYETRCVLPSEREDTFWSFVLKKIFVFPKYRSEILLGVTLEKESVLGIRFDDI